MSAWTDDMEKRLGEHWKAGLSITLIARAMSKEFGRTVSPNAAIGKAHRLGLTQLHPRERAIQPKRQVEQPEPQQPPAPKQTVIGRTAALFREGKTPERIAEILGVGLPSARAYLSSARKLGLLAPARSRAWKNTGFPARQPQPAKQAAPKPLKQAADPARMAAKPSSIARAAALLRDGHTTPEIARRMGVKEATAGVYLSHARGQGLIAATDIPAWYSPDDIKPRPDVADPYGEQTCLWPQVNPRIDPIRCEEARVPTRPYCQAHCRRAYVVVSPAKKVAA